MTKGSPCPSTRSVLLRPTRSRRPHPGRADGDHRRPSCPASTSGGRRGRRRRAPRPRAARRTARRSPAPSTASRTSSPTTGARWASGTATPPPRPTCATSRTPSSPAAVSGPAGSAPTSATRTRSPSRRPTCRPTPSSPTSATGRSSRSCSPTRSAARAGRPGRWSRLRRGRQRVPPRHRRRRRREGPDLQGRRLPQARRHRPGPLVRRLRRQPAGLHRCLRAADRRRRSARPPTTPACRGRRRASQQPPAELPSEDELLTGLGKDPDSPFGSNATAVGAGATTTGRGHAARQPALPVARALPLRAGPPDHPRQVRRRRRQPDRLPRGQHRLEPHVAWSHTVSTAYRFTPYEYKTVRRSPTTYLTDEGPKSSSTAQVEITAKQRRRLDRAGRGGPLPHRAGLRPRRPRRADAWPPASFFALRDANAEHLRTVDTFLHMGKARNVRDLLAKQDAAGGHAVGQHHRRRPLRRRRLRRPLGGAERDQRDGAAAARPRSGWRSSSSPACPVSTAPARAATAPGAPTRTPAGPASSADSNLPEAYRRDWVAQRQRQLLAAQPGAAARGLRPDHRLRAVRALAAHPRWSTATSSTGCSARTGAGAARSATRDLLSFQHQNRVFGAELAKQDGDLVEVVRGRRRRRVLRGARARGTARSDRGSVGPHIFQEFWMRVPGGPGVEVPFDPEQPMSTPRDLNETNPDVVQAMRDALAYLEEQGIDPATPLRAAPGRRRRGRARRSRSAAAEAGAGNANALASRLPAPTPTGSTRSATARRTSRASPSATTAGCRRARSSPTASRPTRRRRGRRPDPAVQPGEVGGLPVDRRPDRPPADLPPRREQLVGAVSQGM